MKLSRREFTALSASVLTAMAAPRVVGGVFRLRRNINTLSVTEIDAFRAGITAMQGLDILDVRSFEYQANVHGAPVGWQTAYPVLPPDVNIYWNQCVHNTTRFLPWHRWYLYYWEEMVRQLCGDDDFTIPYWDVTNDPFLPLALRDPADASNSLYTASRNSLLNSGDAQIEDASHACLNELVFSDFASGTGLEDNPHDLVHNQVGGLMGSVKTSGRDPLFYLHHCNIDRFWECWLKMGNGRANPTNSSWLNDTYDLQSIAGPQNPVVSDALRSTDLGYTYDACPIKPIFKIPKWFFDLVWERWPTLKIPTPDPPPEPYVRYILTFEPLVLDGHDRAFLLPRDLLERGNLGEAGTAAFLLGNIEVAEIVAQGGFYIEAWVTPDASQLATRGTEGSRRIGNFGSFEISALQAHAQHNGAHMHHGHTPPLVLKLDREAIRLVATGRQPAVVFARRGIVDKEGKPFAHDVRAELFSIGALSLVA